MEVHLILVILVNLLSTISGEKEARMIDSSGSDLQYFDPLFQSVPKETEVVEKVSSFEIQVPAQRRLSIPAICAPVASYCPGNTVRVNNDCFRFVRIHMNWHGAKKDCENQRGRLAKPDFAFNNTALQLSTIYRTIIGERYIWIGATDMYSEYAWKWVDGSYLDIKHPHWFPNHPGNKNCATIYQMVKGKLQIYKQPCTTRRNFLCQFDPINAPKSPQLTPSNPLPSIPGTSTTSVTARL